MITIKNLLKRAFWALRRYGFRVFLEKVSRRIFIHLVAIKNSFIPARASVQPKYSPALVNYGDWIAENEPTEEQLTQQCVFSKKYKYRPKISIIVPVFNTPLFFLSDLFHSVFAQTYDQWELCVANGSPENKPLVSELEKYAKMDARVHILHLDKNLGISENSNQALAIANGEYVALLDHDDTLSPFALYEIVTLLQTVPELDLIYSDHDYLSTDGKTRLKPLFKPDWSPEIMLSANYITHLTVLRTSLIRQIGAFNSSTDGAQDYDLFFRVIEKTNQIAHIPKVLYHWRESRESTANNSNAKSYAVNAQILAISRHLKIQGLTQVDTFLDPEGGLRVKWHFPKEKVSIIVLSNGANQLLEKCIDSIIKKTHYPDYEVIIVNNGSKRPDAFPYFKKISKKKNIEILDYVGEFNYSRVNNFAVAHAQGKYLLLLNDDTEVVSEDWIDEMVMWASRSEIGAVGAKLLRPNGLIQHAGVIVGLNGFAGHIFADEHRNANNIFGSINWYRNYSALTAACLMVRKEVYDKMGGLNEEFVLNGSDVDLGLRLNKEGYRLVYNPFVVLKHAESATHKGNVPSSDFYTSFIYYKNVLAVGDPYFNPNLSFWYTTPTFRSKDEVSPMQFSEKHLMSMKNKKKEHTISVSSYSIEATNFSQWFDVSNQDIEKSKEVHREFSKALNIQNVTWFIPEFDNPYYGGIFTILRFANYLQISNDIASQFLLTGSTEQKKIYKKIAEAFPALSKSSVVTVFPDDNWKKVRETDVTISTLWTTAYYSVRFNKTKRKFYFIQDYEPSFYPAGSIYGQVEATYHFGFLGLVNTPGLYEIYKTQYNGLAEYFVPNVDTKLFFPDQSKKKSLRQKHFTVFFYGRPGHSRNAFELGVAALKKVKQKFGDRLTIVSAGAEWDPSVYGLENIIINLGVLKLAETAALYRTCDVGLGMMFTKHPSYLPFEFMASGCMVVSNKNAATEWFLKDGYNCMLTDATPTCISETIEEALLDTKKREEIVRNAHEMILNKYSDWNSQMEKIYQFMRKPL